MSIKAKYSTISEAAEELGVTRQTVSRWISDGKINAEKVGREVLIAKQDIKAYKDQMKVGADTRAFMHNLISYIRTKYDYGTEDEFNVIDAGRKPYFVGFAVVKKDGSHDLILVKFGEVESLKQGVEEPYITVGFKMAIEKIRRETNVKVKKYRRPAKSKQRKKST